MRTYKIDLKAGFEPYSQQFQRFELNGLAFRVLKQK